MSAGLHRRVGNSPLFFIVSAEAVMATDEHLGALIEPSLNDLGYELVQVRMIGGARRTLQVMIEPLERGRPMDVEDCALASQTVSALLDVADPIAGAYALEVSSPGIDRPLVKPADFERFKGYEVAIELERLIDGRRRFKGELLGLDADGEVVLKQAESSARFPFETIKKAKLVLTDELLAAHQGPPQAAEAED